MKKIAITLLMACSLFTMQAQSQKISIDNLKREDYVVTDKVIGASSSSRVWILFIPFGGKSKTKRQDRAYKSALKQCGCDGILQPVYEEHRFVIPLILINFSHRKTTVTGKGYRIKTDADKTNN